MGKSKLIKCWNETFESICKLSEDPRCIVSCQTLFARLHREKLSPEIATTRPLKHTSNNKDYLDETPNTKRCSNPNCLIKKPQPLDAFTRESRGRKGCRSQCKACIHLYRQSDVHKCSKRKSDLKYLYGISIDEYNQKLKEQNFCCAICGSADPAGYKYFVVDHDHNTGEVRKLLCTRCNSMIGMSKNNPDNLRKGANYLEYYLTKSI